MQLNRCTGGPELLETFRSRFEPHSTLINSRITKFLVYNGNLIAPDYPFFLSFVTFLHEALQGFFNYACMTFRSSIKYTSCFLSPRTLTKDFVLIICRLNHHLTDKETELHITLNTLSIVITDNTARQKWCSMQFHCSAYFIDSVWLN